MHAYGAAFDNPGLIVACVIGDGEAETGPLADLLAFQQFLDPARDGAVLPILHLNGYKIANPTILGAQAMRRSGTSSGATDMSPIFVEGDDPATMHRLMAATLDGMFDRHRAIEEQAREAPTKSRARPGL